MDELLLNPELAAFQREWALENITTTFFKCTRWQMEETVDVVNCPYHYFCASTYPGNYPAAVDFSVLFFAAISYLSTMAFTVMEMTRSSKGVNGRQPLRRYLLPSGPLSLSVLLLVLGEGHRINTVFPLSNMGPVLIQLVHVSALAFENPSDRSLKYALFESSTVSGILHASLYLDSIILPYYTGLDALVASTFSGECPSCVCRREALEVGGRLISYRGWSATTFSVVGTLCSRLACGLFGEEKLSSVIKSMLEALAWILIASDCVYLIVAPPHGGAGFPEMAAHGAVCVLICLHVLRRGCNLVAAFQSQCKRMRDLCRDNA